MSNSKPCWWWVRETKYRCQSGCLVFADDREAAIEKAYGDCGFAGATPLSWRGLKVLIDCIIPLPFDASQLAQDGFIIECRGRFIRIQP